MKKYILFIALLAIPFFTHAAITWQETQPAGDLNKNWDKGISSADGQVLVARIASGGGEYLSVNGGSSWTVPPTSSILAVSGDGQTLLFKSVNRLYLSTDEGVSLTETQPKGDTTGSWTDAAIDADASTLIVSEYQFLGTSGLHVSTDGGASWTEVEPDGPGDKTWEYVAVSADGTHMAAAGVFGKVYISANSGTSWTDVSPAGANGNWYSVTMSSDGETIVLADGDCLDDTLFISHDFGDTWAQVSVSGNAWECWPTREGIAVSGNGQRILAGTDGNRIYYSENGGTSWSETQPTGAGVNKSWYAVAMSDDGTQFLAGAYNGRLYLGTAPLPDPELTVTKVVVNDDGGTSVAGDFTLTLSGLSITSGVATTTAAGTYTVAETGPDGYTGTFTGDCAADGSITMTAGNTYTCTLTNDDDASAPAPAGGGTSFRHASLHVTAPDTSIPGTNEEAV